jgi:anaerobic magnesium-protoporphyrin IX monomethyl ester cyclase
MRILFIIADIFLGEPLGVLQLSAILKAAGHETRLITLRRHSLPETLKVYQPDVVAYSAMSPESAYFEKADQFVRQWISISGLRVIRIMGGPHPTFFPEVVQEMSLDAICIGEGDRAILKILERFQTGDNFSGIPNVLTPGDSLDQMSKELIIDLDSLPFPDKTIYFEAMPVYRTLSMRALMASRGCPYHCTYCFNHAYRKMFQGAGPIVRRRSPNSVIDELKYIIRSYPLVRLVKFNDDTFAHKVDDWLLEFAERYQKEINLPFYCLMRSNAMSEDMARILSRAGCKSISMSVESGNERIRNDLLKRGLSDDMVIHSFRNAHKYGIKTYGNTILAIPGTTLDDDYNSFFFTKRLRMKVPTFCIFRPYPKLELSELAVRMGILSLADIGNHQLGEPTPLNCYTPEEKHQQLALSQLGTLLADMPEWVNPFVKMICRWPLLGFYRLLGNSYMIIKAGIHIFPRIYPKNPIKMIKLILDSIKFFLPPKDLRI